MSVCPSCGKPIEPTWTFCGGCGTRIDIEAAIVLNAAERPMFGLASGTASVARPGWYLVPLVAVILFVIAAVWEFRHAYIPSGVRTAAASLLSSERSPIRVIQESAFPGGNPAKPIGPTFANLSAPFPPTWETFVSDQGITVVEVSGTVTDPAQAGRLFDVFPVWTEWMQHNQWMKVACANLGVTRADSCNVFEERVTVERRRLLVNSTLLYRAQFFMTLDPATAMGQHFTFAHLNLQIEDGPLAGMEADVKQFTAFLGR